MDSTRIADLPENITMNTSLPPSGYMGNDVGYMGGNGGMRHPQQGPPQLQSYQPNIDVVHSGGGGGGVGNGQPNTNYMQMNVHPNPYGNGPPNGDSLGLPQQTHTTRPSNNPYVSHAEQPVHLAHLPQHQLPSRDIPHDTTSYSQDEEVAPNYIPAPKITSEFVKEYEDNYARKEEHIKKQKRAIQSMDDVFLELRAPLIIALLYLLFQSPVFQTLVFKRFSILGVYSPDGNVNMVGLLLKSVLFGVSYYALEKMAEYVR
jgi:hypothetical protein